MYVICIVLGIIRNLKIVKSKKHWEQLQISFTKWDNLSNKLNDKNVQL
jgi:hypothetical protein